MMEANTNIITAKQESRETYNVDSKITAIGSSGEIVGPGIVNNNNVRPEPPRSVGYVGATVATASIVGKKLYGIVTAIDSELKLHYPTNEKPKPGPSFWNVNA